MQIRIGTRKSPLALAQAGHIRQLLMQMHAGLEIELVHITTSGDKFTDRPLADIGGKGLFTKEIEEALYDKSIDLAVHSMKDMQTVLPDGLVIACVPKREDPRDALIGAASLDAIPKGAVFGTSSLRRGAQLLMRRPDIQIKPLRGNVQTRLDKLQSGEFAATMLAQAGLNRLSLAVPAAALDVSEFLPAVGQGALGIECRADDSKIQGLLSPLMHKETEIATRCERAFLRTLDGSCRTPIAGMAVVKGDTLHFNGLVVEPDGSRPRPISMDGAISDAEALGEAAGHKIKAGN